MGWERRGNKLYYFRKQRGEDGRVRSVYCGSGERGEAAAREDKERRAVALLPEPGPRATGEMRHTQHVNAREGAAGAPALANMLRCDDGAGASPADDPEQLPRAAGVIPRAEEAIRLFASRGVPERHAGATRTRRYRPAPGSERDPNRYFVPPRRRR